MIVPLFKEESLSDSSEKKNFKNIQKKHKLITNKKNVDNIISEISSMGIPIPERPPSAIFSP
jgi:hypothetical protein